MPDPEPQTSNLIRTVFSVTALLTAATAALHAQPFARDAEPFPVQVHGSLLDLPCTGGFNSPQHQFVDIDGDGDFDLVVLDVDLSVNFYRNEGTRFQPVFKLRNELVALPAFRVWFRFVDLDGDGRIDLCTEDSTFQGVRVYKNTGTLQSPQFTLLIPTVHDTSGADMFAGANSIPAFVDIDRDGDFDFFSSNITGTINFYRNVGTPVAPRFAFVSASWENILIFGDTCTGSPVPLQPSLHGAASYSFADIDGDNDYDMFVGDLYHSGIFTIRNTGTPQAPRMECGTAWFPPNQPLLTGGFNHTSFVDIDGDGDLDLFATPLAGIIQRDGFIFYRNNGTASSPLLQFVTANFITTIDVGLSARPVFADIDGDGDADMFLGNIGAPSTALAFYRNTGSSTAPAYVLVDSAYLSVPNNYYFSPAFIDIDGDGDLDLFAGLYDGRLRFYRNTGTPQNPQLTAAPFVTDTINVGFAATPTFVDIDGDGRKDLFIGNKRGEVRYYRNIGTASSFVPQLVTSQFLGLSLGEDSFITPVFADIDGDGDFDFFYGRETGNVTFYENTGTPTSPNFVLRSSGFAGTTRTQESAPAFVDIESDGDLDLVVGTRLGGIAFYRNLRPTSVDESSAQVGIQLLQNYPNPSSASGGNASTTIRFSVRSLGFVSLRVYDVLGREVATLVNEPVQAGEHSVAFDTSRLSSGIYIYRLTASGYTKTRRMVVLR